MRAIDLYDEAFIDAREGGSGSAPPVLHISSDMAGVPEGRGNIAYRAAEFMLARFPGRLSRVDIKINKRIPVAAGLAGGSADAAAVLLYLAKTLAPEAGLAVISEWGAELGSDVPFCLYACAAANPGLGYEGAGTALAEGVGEHITPVRSREKARVVLVKPQVEIPTKQVYELYDEWENKDGFSDNDLEEPCSQAWPVVAETLRTMKQICGVPNVKVQLSGSGPSVFAFFEGGASGEAERLYIKAKKVFEGFFVYLAEAL